MDTIKNLGIYSKQFPLHHGRAVLRVLRVKMTCVRAVEMDSLEGYADLLRREGHEVEIIIMKGMEMPIKRWKLAEFIFRQNQRSGAIEREDTFDEDVVDVSEIVENHRYY